MCALQHHSPSLIAHPLGGKLFASLYSLKVIGEGKGKKPHQSSFPAIPHWPHN